MKTSLPPLAFGGRQVKFDQCPYEMGDQLRVLLKGLKVYESMVKPSEFLSQSSLININGLQLAATSSTPVRFKVDKTDNAANSIILLPFSGEGALTVGGRNVYYRTNTAAAFLPDQALEGESSTRSLMMVNVNTDRLELTARAMLGYDPDTPSGLDLDTPREVNLHHGAVSFDAIFRQYANIINQFILMPTALTMLGLDDSFYSAIVMMLRPAMILGSTGLVSEMKHERRLLDQTCQYIKANLTSPITLVMLDNVSMMSRRKLHYAFQDRFGCSPMQWVRDERLLLVRSLLINAHPWQTVTSIALECGFTKMSTFAQFYKNRFGELPSATLAKSKFN